MADKKRKTAPEPTTEDTDFSCLIYTYEEEMDSQSLYIVPRKDLTDEQYDKLLHLATTHEYVGDWFWDWRNEFLMQYQHYGDPTITHRVRLMQVNCFE